jgi:hypothetical protein
MISRRKAIVGGLTAGALVGIDPLSSSAGTPGGLISSRRGDGESGGFDPNNEFPSLISQDYPTLSFVPINPYRALDTRANRFGRQYRDEPPLEFNVFTDLVDVPRFPQVLIDATYAVSYNLTVAATEGSNGFLTVYPADLPTVPNVSSINWSSSGLDLANGGVVAIADITVKIACGGPPNVSAHVIFDITGIYVRSTL